MGLEDKEKDMSKTNEKIAEILIEKHEGRMWEKDAMKRVYINDVASLLSWTVERYKSGAIKKALDEDGDKISNNKAWKFLVNDFFFDVVTGTVGSRHGSDAQHAIVMRAIESL